MQRNSYPDECRRYSVLRPNGIDTQGDSRMGGRIFFSSFLVCQSHAVESTGFESVLASTNKILKSRHFPEILKTNVCLFFCFLYVFLERFCLVVIFSKFGLTLPIRDNQVRPLSIHIWLCEMHCARKTLAVISRGDVFLILFTFEIHAYQYAMGNYSFLVFLISLLLLTISFLEQ